MLKEFFVRNPTPACVKEIFDEDNDHVPKIPFFGNCAMPFQPPLKQDQQEFFKLMAKNMQKMQHSPLQGQTKNVIESCDHKETVVAD